MIFKGIFQKNEDLPVTGDCILRENLRNHHFARNRGLAFTGKSQKSPFCP